MLTWFCLFPLENRTTGSPAASVSFSLWQSHFAFCSRKPYHGMHSCRWEQKPAWCKDLKSRSAPKSWLTVQILALNHICLGRGNRWQGPRVLTVPRSRCSAGLGKSVARPTSSHNITLLHTQLLCEIREIGGKAHLLSRYHALAHSIARRGRENWWQDPSTLTVQCCCTLNCSAGLC